MKIIYCIAGTFNSGGMERVLANKANYLVNHGYEVVIVTTDQQGREPYFAMDERIVQYDLGINYQDNAQQGIVKKAIGYFFKQRKHKRELAKLLYQLKAHIVISMFDHEVSFLYQIQDGSKKVLEIHFSRFKRIQYGRKGIWGKVDKIRSANDLKLAKQYDRFVVLTHEDKGYWGKLPNMEVIPNANSFVPEGQAALENKRVIAVGRYDYQKAFDELIAIWEKVSSEYPEWRLDIFGHGPLRDDLQQQINQLGLTEIVRLCAPVKNIAEEYLNSSVLAMTSRYEGLPMALLEAQVCGLPMVSYACKCGPRDIIQEGVNGYVTDEGDQASFAESLSLLMSDPQRRKEMGAKAIEMSADFSEQRIMASWENLFKTVLNG